MGLLRADRCSVCGRSVRGMEDARKEGGRWYCSPSCLLQGSPGKWKQPERSAPARAVRRVVKWTLIIVGLLVVASIVGVFLGTGSGTKTGTQTFTGVAAPSSTPRRGDRSHPVALGRPMRLAGSWRLKITSVTRNADSVVTRYVDARLGGTKPNGPLSPGAQYVMVGVSLEYVGGGSSSFTNIGPRIHVIGKHNAPYDTYCIPPHAINGSGLNEDVFSGHTLTGNICFEVAKNDVTTLRLYVDPLNYPTRGKRVWFALR